MRGEREQGNHTSTSNQPGPEPRDQCWWQLGYQLYLKTTQKTSGFNNVVMVINSNPLHTVSEVADTPAQDTTEKPLF